MVHLDCTLVFRKVFVSLRQLERQADVEQLQEIKRQENEITSKHQALVVHCIILASTAIVFQRWRISYNNAHLKEFIDENLEMRNKLRKYERQLTV